MQQPPNSRHHMLLIQVKMLRPPNIWASFQLECHNITELLHGYVISFKTKPRHIRGRILYYILYSRVRTALVGRDLRRTYILIKCINFNPIFFACWIGSNVIQVSGMYPANLIPQQNSQPPPRRPLTPSQQTAENQAPYQVCSSYSFYQQKYQPTNYLTEQLYHIELCRLFHKILDLRLRYQLLRKDVKFYLFNWTRFIPFLCNVRIFPIIFF